VRKPALALLLALAAPLAAPAGAVLCAIDQVPAATLLVPYFEVDLAHSSGMTTLFTITNATPNAALTHVTVWTDWGIQALTFDLYLTGHDLQTINLRDVIANGLMPRTASAGQDPADTISPKGSQSQDIVYASCNGLLPGPNLSAAFQAHLQAALTGGSSVVYGNKCGGSAHGDQIARGYVTVDVVTKCSLYAPSEPEYYDNAVIGMANQLLGDMMLVDPSQNLAFPYPVVHLEAGALPPGAPSFYGRYAAGNADAREPLPSTFAVPFETSPPDATTSLLVWREASASGSPVNCGTAPSWVPLPTPPVVAVDEQTDAGHLAADLPLATQRLDLGAGPGLPLARGTLLVALDHGGFPSRPAQAWVLARQTRGTLELGVVGHPLDDTCGGERFRLLFHDGFEAELAPWSGREPGG
jgi:hypothetical protein